jgi:hypothetical protein
MTLLRKATLSRAIAGLVAVTVALLLFSAGLAAGRTSRLTFHCVKGSPYPNLEMTCHLEAR